MALTLILYLLLILGFVDEFLFLFFSELVVTVILSTPGANPLPALQTHGVAIV